MSDERLPFEGLAERLGREAGANAAEWVILPDRMTKEQMLRILKGIEDGDPEIMDAYSEPLLGEDGSDYDITSLARELGVAPGSSDMDVYAENWEEGASAAFWEKIADICRIHSTPECNGDNHGGCPKHPDIIIPEGIVQK